MTSSDHSTLILDQIRQAPLPQQASLDLVAAHAKGLEHLASGAPKHLLLNDLCDFLDGILDSWKAMFVGHLGNGLESVGQDACGSESIASFHKALRALPDLEVVYPVGKLSVESSMWLEACPARTVRHFGCFPVANSALLVFTSNQANRLEPSMDEVVRLVAQIAAFIIDHEAPASVSVAPTGSTPESSANAASSGLAAAASLGNEVALLVDNEGVILEANDAAEGLLRQSSEELIGLALTQLGATTEAARGLKALSESPSSDGTPLCLRQANPAGNVWVEAKSHALPTSDNDQNGQTVLFCRDLTTERILQAKVTNTDEQLKATAQSESVVLFRVDRRGVIASAKGGFLSNSQIEASSLEGRNAWGFCQEESLRRKLWKQLRRVGSASGLIDTEHGPLKITLAATLGPNGKPQTVHGIAIHAPATSPQQSVASAVASSAPTPAPAPVAAPAELCPSWLVSLQVSKDAVVVTDTDGKIRFMNAGAEQLFNCRMNEAEGQRFQQLGSFGELDPVRSFLDETQPASAIHQVRMTRHDGTALDLNLAGAPVKPQDGVAQGVILCCRQEEPPVVATEPEPVLATSDTPVAERQRLEQENFRALSLFAGGIAHDLNNILTSLVGNVSLANMLVNDVPEASERLIEAERACFRAKDLSHQLLTFAKGSTPVKKVSRLQDLIEQCTENYLRGSKSVPRILTPSGLWSADIDEGQISQVLENLILNADHSMPHGGMVTISSENVHHVPSPENASLPLDEGVYVKISILDEGPGIPKDQLEYIFRPYHTANESGRGLGLATTFTIVKNHGGHVVASSKFGHGTEFSVYLPATGKTKQPTEEPVPLQPGETIAAMEHGRVLVIDDEKSIRDLATTTLKLMGCDVVTCPSSSEGVERFIRANQDGQPFDLVIMDLTIPGDLGGNEAMQQILSISPKALGVASSGYSEGSIMAHYREYGFQAALSKPYNISDLQRVVSNMLIS